MFFSYAMTFVCSVFSCTQVNQQNGPASTEQFVSPQLQVSTVVQVETSPSALFFVNSLTVPQHNHEDNISKSVFKIESAVLAGVKDENEVNHLLIPAQDQPKPNQDNNVSTGTSIDDIVQAPDMEDDNSHEENIVENNDPNPIVHIKDGGLKGFIMESISGRKFTAFQSVPFAKSPLGRLRFKAPEKNLPWKGTRDAIAESPTCIQADYIQNYAIIGQEDCLFLNVYTPKIPKPSQGRKAELLPVMVFIHGGGWFFSSSKLYGPAYLLDHQNIVLVSMNYRLSMFGFLSTGDEKSPGNYGLKDQTLALKWVQENIAAFGGDKNKVTIFGESAGAGSVQFHMVSKLSNGLFHGAISQSGCATCFWSISERAAEITRQYSSYLNCTGSSEEIMTCLRKKDATQLVAAQLHLLEWSMYPVVIFGPVLEFSHPGAFLDEPPEQVYKRKGAANVPWITGFNADEGAINIAMLLINNKSISQMNDEWNTYGPIFLDVKNSENNSVEVADKIRQYYLEDKPVNFQNRKRIIKMFSDRYVIACGVKAIRLHAEYSEQPVYSYQLAFKGKYSTVQLLGQNPADWGVSHMDDLIYLFNNTAYYTTLNTTDEEYQMSKIITSLWTNFAITGKPLLTTSENKLEDIWSPVVKEGNLDSSVDYLELNLNPKMIRDPFQERVKFWRRLRLADF